MAFSWDDGFETDLGNWNQVTGDDTQDWTRTNGGTPSTATGPSGAANGTWYIFSETSSPVAGGDTFILESDVIDGSVNIITEFSWNEHMAGQDMDDFNSTLEVQAWDGSTWNTIYTQTGQNGATADGLNWQAKEAFTSPDTLDDETGGPYNNADLQLRFLFTVGGTGLQFQNDTGLDDIVVVGVDRNAYEQEGYRWRNDDGVEAVPGGSPAGATWSQDQDTPDSVPKETNTRLRVLVDATGNPVSQQATLQYKRDDEFDSEWRDV